MKGKKSFTAYCDWIETFEELSDEDAGKLIKHLLRYVNDLDPEPPNVLIKAVFASIRATLKRDLEKWQSIVNRNRQNGSKGGRPEKPKKPSGLSGNPTKPKKADSDSDRDSDSVREVKKEISKEKQFAEQVRSLSTSLPDSQVQKFIDYWTEKSPKGKKMKFEKQNTFDPARRLRTWEANYQDWQKEKGSAEKEKPMSTRDKLERLNKAIDSGEFKFTDE